MPTPEEAARSLGMSMEDLAKWIDKMSTAAGHASEEMDSLRDSQKRLKDIAAQLATGERKLGETTAGLNAEYGKVRDKVVQLRGAYASYQKDMESVDREVKKAINAQKSYAEKILITKRNMGELIGPVTKIGAAFGGQAITLDKLKTSVLTYNNSLFKLMRTQQGFGKGADDISKALKYVDKNTTLSRNQFMKFANTMTDGFKGVRPSTVELGKLASTIQSKVGPALEDLEATANDLMGIMQKFPAMYGAIADAMELTNKSNLTDQETKRLGITKQSIRMQLVSGKITEQEYLKLRKLTTTTTKGQSKEIDFNKKVAKASQAGENAVLAMGKAAEGAMKLAAQATEVFYLGLGRIPVTAMAATMSMNALTIAVQGYNQAVQMGYASPGGFGGGRGGGGGRGRGRGAATSARASGGGFASGAAGAGAAGAAGAAAMSRRGGAVRGRTGGSGGAIAITGALAAMGAVMSGQSEKKEREAAGDKNATKAGVAKGGAAAGIAATGGVIGGAVGAKFGSVGTGAMIGTMIASAADEAMGLSKWFSDKIVPAVKKEDEIQESVLDKEERQLLEVSKQRANYVELLSAAKEFSDTLQAQVDLLSSMGINLGGMTPLYEQNIDAAKQQVDMSNQFLTTMQKTYASLMKEGGIEIISGSQEDRLKSMNKLSGILNQKAADATNTLIGLRSKLTGEEEKDKAVQEEINALEVQRMSFLGAAGDISKKTTELLGGQKNVVAAINLYAIKEAKQAEEANAVMTERLGVQRQLMEAAQFGFGASIAMLQEQVNLEYELMTIQQKSVKELRKKWSEELNISEAQAAQIENARSLSEAQEVSKKYTDGSAASQAKVVGYWTQHQKQVTEVMKHQQKIYELTKDMREGYMDAFREMSANVGEFTKIIGTQETGFTQLMDTVKEVNGADVLNTMKGGAMVQTGGEGYAARTGVAGRMTTGGPVFRDQGTTEEANKNIFGYSETKRAYDDLMAGNERGAPTAGGAVTGAMDYAGGALREENSTLKPQIMENTVMTGVLGALTAFSTSGGSLVQVNPAVAKGIPLGGEMGYDPDKGNSILNWARQSGQLPQGRAAVAPARNVPTPVGTLDTPNGNYYKGGQMLFPGVDKGNDKEAIGYLKSVEKTIEIQGKIAALTVKKIEQGNRLTEKQTRTLAVMYGQTPKMLHSVLGNNQVGIRQVLAFLPKLQREKDAAVAKSAEWKNNISSRFTDRSGALAGMSSGDGGMGSSGIQRMGAPNFTMMGGSGKVRRLGQGSSKVRRLGQGSSKVRRLGQGGRGIRTMNALPEGDLAEYKRTKRLTPAMKNMYWGGGSTGGRVRSGGGERVPSANYYNPSGGATKTGANVIPTAESLAPTEEVMGSNAQGVPEEAIGATPLVSTKISPLDGGFNIGGGIAGKAIMAAGLGGKLVQKGMQRSVSGSYSKWQSGGARAGSRRVGSLLKGVPKPMAAAMRPNLMATVGNTTAENYIAKKVAANSRGLATKGVVGKAGGGMLRPSGIIGGFGGSFLGEDLAQLAGAKKGGVAETASSIGGGILGSIAASNPIALAGLGGYAAGSLIDKKAGTSDFLGTNLGARNTPLAVDEFKDTFATKIAKRRKRAALASQQVSKTAAIPSPVTAPPTLPIVPIQPQKPKIQYDPQTGAKLLPEKQRGIYNKGVRMETIAEKEAGMKRASEEVARLKMTPAQQFEADATWAEKMSKKNRKQGSGGITGGAVVSGQAQTQNQQQAAAFMQQISGGRQIASAEEMAGATMGWSAGGAGGSGGTLKVIITAPEWLKVSLENQSSVLTEIQKAAST